MKERGNIGIFGGSNWTYRRIEEANEYAYKKNLAPFSVSSPGFSLADQLGDVWDDTCVTLTGKRGQQDRNWYQNNKMPVIAYSALAHGMFTGKMKSSDMDHASDFLDMFALRGYAFPENFERLRRCELLAKEKQATVSQIALAWIFRQRMNLFAVVSTSSPDRMKKNIEALELPLSDQECEFLNLERDTYINIYQGV